MVHFARLPLQSTLYETIFTTFKYDNGKNNDDGDGKYQSRMSKERKIIFHLFFTGCEEI